MTIYDIAKDVKMNLRVIQKRMFRDLSNELTNEKQLDLIEDIKILQKASNAIDHYFKVL